MRSASLLCLLLATACLSPADPTPVRHFEPARAAHAPAGDGAPLQLFLRNVDARATLRQDMVWRLSAVESVFDETNRWSMQPAAFVREALATALFVDGGHEPVRSNQARILDVRLLRFEGDLEGTPLARAALEATLSTPERGVPRIRRFEATEPLAGDDAPALARALGAALGTAVAELRAWVESEGR